MNLYETTFIVNPQSDDAVIDEQVKSVSQLIAKNGGKVVREERLGTRRLAYPIQNLHQGYYAVFLYEAEPSFLPNLERHMKLGEAFMRHLTIRFEGDPEKVYGEKRDFANKDDRRQTVERTESASAKEPTEKAPEDTPSKPSLDDETARISDTPTDVEETPTVQEPKESAEEEEL